MNFDPEKTREEITSLIAHHVTAVNYIYRDTKFDGRVEHRNIKFEVQRIKVSITLQICLLIILHKPTDFKCNPNTVDERDGNEVVKNIFINYM